MRRAVLILLALVLVPAMATATSYQCMYDGETRSACCCPTQARPDQAPAGAQTLRADCCCKITQATPTARAVGTTTAEPPPFVARVAVALEPVFVPPPISITAIDHSRAQGDPPCSSLLARHCSLLL